MSIISDMFAGGAEGVLKGVKDVVSTFKADPLELARLEQALQKAQYDFELGLSQAQAQINQEEAKSADYFVSRWRPFIGWVCGVGFSYAVLVQPMLTWLSLNQGWMTPPTLDTSILVPTMTGMLGLAGMRTYEKFKKVTK